jgi:hypothetical protein
MSKTMIELQHNNRAGDCLSAIADMFQCPERANRRPMETHGGTLNRRGGRRINWTL